MHNEQMATVRIQNELTALLQFLESDEYTKGHPEESIRGMDEQGTTTGKSAISTYQTKGVVGSPHKNAGDAGGAQAL